MLKILKASSKDFQSRWKKILEQRAQMGKEIEEQLEKIFLDIKKKGIKAVIKYAKLYDNFSGTEKDIKVKKSELNGAKNLLSRDEKRAIEKAKQRIEWFHKKQKPKGYRLKENGGYIRERWLALERVGIYIPAGKFPLASTVLMCAIPAKIAGVGEIVLTTPANGEVHPAILYSASLLGIDEIYKLGGAQAIFALALGASPIKKVDKIVGPGGLWASRAKVYAYKMGLVGIDTLAGPSEIAILADGSAKSELIIADIKAQLEHGEDSWAFLISTSKNLLEKVADEFRGEKANLVLIQARSKKEMIELANQIAPEHLEIMLKNPEEVLEQIYGAGAVFVGEYSPVALGDYLAGTNHCLPTGARARFESPLGVWDFMKRQSIVWMEKHIFLKLQKSCKDFARLEGLFEHARSISIRAKDLK